MVVVLTFETGGHLIYVDKAIEFKGAPGAQVNLEAINDRCHV